MSLISRQSAASITKTVSIANSADSRETEISGSCQSTCPQLPQNFSQKEQIRLIVGRIIGGNMRSWFLLASSATDLL